MKRIYLDNNATTAVDPSVLQAMLIDLEGEPANPSSLHSFGREARARLTQAREQVGAFFSTPANTVRFTSGATESNNLFLRGLKGEGEIITTAIEHSSIYKTAQSLEKLKPVYVPVGLWGAPKAQDIEAALSPKTKAIALSAANNETGVKIDVEAISHIAKTHNIPLLIDAVAWVGKEPFSLCPGISALSISGHKFHAPKGIGALLLSTPPPLIPLATGGGQEYMSRAGTENLAGILGLAKALEILSAHQAKITQHLIELCTHFETELKRTFPSLYISGEGPRIAGVSNVAFPGIDGETLLIQLDLAGVASSHGSACASGAMEPSRVLTQMGVPRKVACGSLRFSFSRMNTRKEIDTALERITTLVKKLS